MKRISKKVLAVILSALMVCTSVPMSVFAVQSTSETPSADTIAANLMTAITTLESKFDGTIYYDMGDIYADYTAAVKAYDQYCYGDCDVDMQTHIDKLNEYTDEDGEGDLKVWLSADGNTYNGYSGNYLQSKNLKKVYNADDESDNIGNYYTNLLWTQTGSNASTARYTVADGKFTGPVTGEKNKDRNMSAYLYYPQVVLMYDGIVTPRSTVTTVFKGGSAEKSRYIFCIYPYVNDNTGYQGFKLSQWWGAMDDAVNANRNLTLQGQSISNTNVDEGNGALALRYSVKTGTFSSTWYTNNYSFSNVWQYGLTMSNDQEYDTVKPTVRFKAQAEEQRNDAVTDDLETTMTGNTDVYILNFKRLIDAAKTRRGEIAMNSSQQRYRYGGAAELFAAYDAITGLDPNEYFTQSNRITECATAITSAINDLNAAAVPVKDSTFTGYASLREAIAGTSGRRKDYLDAVASDLAGIDETTWDGFAGTNGVYTVAVNMFKNPSNLYTQDSAAATAATALSTYVLYPNRVDTTTLETVINEAANATANKSYFTNDSFTSSGLAGAVNLAKRNVWGNVNNYGMEKYKLIDNAGNQAIVATEVQRVSTALMTLEINTAAKSAAYNASLDDVLDDASYVDTSKYSNADILVSAVGAANTYKARNLSIAVVQEGCVNDKINEYLDVIKSIRDAIENLQLAFSEINDGDMANTGSDVTTYASHPASGRDLGLGFQRNNNQIIFRKTHTTINKSLGVVKFQFRNGEVRDGHLDAISLNDTCNTNKEYYARGCMEVFGIKAGPSGTLTDAEIAEINAGVNYDFALTNKTTNSTSDGAKVSLGNITLSTAGGDPIATRAVRDTEGNITEVVDVGSDATAAEKDFTNDLKQVERGDYPLIGIHCGRISNASMTSALTATLPATTEAKTLTANTKPILVQYEATPYLGCAYSWGLVAANATGGVSGGAYDAGIEWRGYAHARTQYTQTLYVVDVSYLFDLWDLCAEAAMSSAGYTTESYNNFITAYRSSRTNFSYGTMTAAQITTEVQNRYTSLWNAYNALVRCASNQVLYDAQSAALATYRAGNASTPATTYSDATWNAFVNAYTAVNNALSGTYSDANVREMDVNDETANNEMNALATALANAKANLAPVVKLAPLYIAAENIINYIESTIKEDDPATAEDESKHYTAESLQAVANALKNNYSLLKTYTNGTTEVAYTEAQYNERESEINSIYKSASNKVTSDLLGLLVESSIDDSAFAAAKKIAVAQVNPDAAAEYQEILTRIETLTTETEVEMYPGFTVGTTTMQPLSLTGVNYDTQEAADEAPYEILETLTEVIKYTVTVDGTTYTDANHPDGKFAYGEEVTITKDAPTAWYYSFTSTTASNNIEKYFGVSDHMTITVTGNAKLRTGTPKTENNCRINYVRNTMDLDGNVVSARNYDSSYVAANTKITLPQPLNVAFYEFTGYTIDGDAYSIGDTYTVTESTNIVANYELKTDEEGYETVYNVTVYNINNTKNVASLSKTISFETYYNDRVDITREGLNGGYNNPDGSKKLCTVWVNGEEKTFSGRTTYVNRQTDPFVAWAVVPASLYDDWFEGATDNLYADLAQSAEKIVKYGEDYSFNVVEDTYLIPLTQAWYDADDENGFIDTAAIDENGATVTNHASLIDNNNKFSMIGQFTLPDGARLIETGMLFTSGTNVEELDTDLSLSKAGTNGIYRLKSSKHTVGNQFVISMRKEGFEQGETVVYQAYLVYEVSDGNGGTKQVVQYSPAPVTALAIV